MAGFLGRRELGVGCLGRRYAANPLIICTMPTDPGRNPCWLRDPVTLLECHVPTLLELAPHHAKHGALLQSSVDKIGAEKIAQKEKVGLG